MALIKITTFGGMIPKLADRVLPDGAAIAAVNVRLQSGEIRSMNSPALSYVPASPKTGADNDISRQWEPPSDGGMSTPTFSFHDVR